MRYVHQTFRVALNDAVNRGRLTSNPMLLLKAVVTNQVTMALDNSGRSAT